MVKGERRLFNLLFGLAVLVSCVDAKVSLDNPDTIYGHPGPDQINNRSYYILEAGYTCTLDNEVISSWTRRIQFLFIEEEFKYCLFQDRCTLNPDRSIEGVCRGYDSTLFDFSDDLSSFDLLETTETTENYVYHADPPFSDE